MFRYYFIIAIFFISLIAILLLIFTPNVFSSWETNSPSNSNPGVELLDPEMAPADIKPLVMQGFNIMLETKKYVPEYAGDKINCANCHFNGGNNLGGFNNGISLVGITQFYPRKLPHNQQYTLADRINSCFEKSLNGKPLPNDSQEMNAIIAYLNWISRDANNIPNLPWRGLKKLDTSHIANSQNGSQIYATKCALCHGNDGEGQERVDDLSYPPLWGKNSFNSSAGMNDLAKLASFVYYNMPYQESKLTEEEAIDVASFVISQPRPIFNAKD